MENEKQNKKLSDEELKILKLEEEVYSCLCSEIEYQFPEIKQFKLKIKIIEVGLEEEE